MSNKDRFVTYLQHYADKNLDAVSAMFADDIRLRDWKISVVGKELAVAETKKNFDSAESIEIEVLELYEGAGSVAGELRIVVDRTEILYVVDVIGFDSDGKILSIKAYLGRED